MTKEHGFSNFYILTRKKNKKLKIFMNFEKLISKINFNYFPFINPQSKLKMYNTKLLKPSKLVRLETFN